MGLLDEAIRDHLELKRRRGGDPTEIARAEHEALEPVFPPEEPAGDEVEPVAGVAVALPEPAPQVEVAPAQEFGDPAAAPDLPSAGEPDFSTVGQETAELDMQAVLDADPAFSALASGDDGAIEDAMLEWETPGEPGSGSLATAEHGDAIEAAEAEEGPDVPGQERLSFE